MRTIHNYAHHENNGEINTIHNRYLELETCLFVTPRVLATVSAIVVSISLNLNMSTANEVIFIPPAQRGLTNTICSRVVRLTRREHRITFFLKKRGYHVNLSQGYQKLPVFTVTPSSKPSNK